MYDLSSTFHSFYKKHVILPKVEKNKLFEKKKLNIDRLKEGLKKYNEENDTSYKIAENIVQGSVAMSTVIKNENNDYDIDVAIIFDKSNIPEGTTTVKNIVVNALKMKCTGFKVPPYAKTNCVRIEYCDGYHIDFAIYRRFRDENGKFQYEHCGSEWRSRDPKAITAWFIQENKNKDYKLRELVRLLKMFSRSREYWSMPGGLVQSVLANEKYQTYSRVDERFYYTLKAIRDRLFWNKDVYNPTDASQTLKLIKKDDEKINNLYNRLTIYLNKLDILFDPNCTKKQAMDAWKEFFNHDFWNPKTVQESASKSYAFVSEGTEEEYDYRETEEFIEYLFPIDLQYEVELDCKVTQDGWRVASLHEFLQSGKLKPNKKLDFTAKTNTPAPYEIYWKVKNKGIVAKKRNDIRGQIIKRGLQHTENTKFKGEHFVEVYIVKNDICVARAKLDVPIAEL